MLTRPDAAALRDGLNWSVTLSFLQLAHSTLVTLLHAFKLRKLPLNHLTWCSRLVTISASSSVSMAASASSSSSLLPPHPAAAAPAPAVRLSAPLNLGGGQAEVTDDVITFVCQAAAPVGQVVLTPWPAVWHAAAPPVPCSLNTYHSSKSSPESNSEGIRKLSRLHSSPTLFCSGVPAGGGTTSLLAAGFQAGNHNSSQSEQQPIFARPGLPQPHRPPCCPQTCEQQTVVSPVSAQLGVELAAGVLQAVPLVHADVAPVDTRQAGPAGLSSECQQPSVWKWQSHLPEVSHTQSTLTLLLPFPSSRTGRNPGLRLLPALPRAGAPVSPAHEEVVGGQHHVGAGPGLPAATAAHLATPDCLAGVRVAPVADDLQGT